MANARYRKGAELERKIMASLKEKGYHVVRSAGSKGPFDLIALGKPGEVLVIQVKAGRGKMTRAERMELVDLATDHGATPVLYEGMLATVLGRAA
jgi:Holliday junction resolvase